MKVRIFVSLKPGVLDPQGRAVHHALEGLGFDGVEEVRVGRMIELDVSDSVTDNELDKMCRQLLANMVIENYRIVTFPGSNCDRDLAVALEAVSGVPAFRVWHGDAELPGNLDFIALPGGFSYGDYLRSGAMAAHSPVMR